MVFAPREVPTFTSILFLCVTGVEPVRICLKHIVTARQYTLFSQEKNEKTRTSIVLGIYIILAQY